MKAISVAAVLVTACAGAPGAPSEVLIETVTVGNPGNPDDTRGYGGVDYVYAIGKYEVTTRQYTAFLNAVAVTDPHGLYNPNMWLNEMGCKIQREGEPGSYAYSVAPDRENRPVNYVSWGDAARFANWLHNGQPTGVQDLTTTEDGAYFLNGALGDSALLDITREPDATWALPSEGEWYKAAYHQNDGVTGNYWSYPMGSSAGPNNGAGGDTGNSANYWDGGYTIGSPYWQTEVGFFSLSEGPYGTFDQGGNVSEWNEAMIHTTSRGNRGGSWFWGSSELHASAREEVYYPTDEFNDVGFRVVLATPPPDCPGDLDGDSQVGLSDLSVLLGNYGTDSGMAYEDGDLDSDGDVDLADLSALLGVYGMSCD